MFITLEGTEGSGKTTQLLKIIQFLESKGHTCVVTREPGATDIGQKIRAILLDPDHRHLSPTAELLLYAADRAQHITTVIQPALAAGKTVICDRFADSTTVYQGYARGLDLGTIETLHQLVLRDIAPDLTLLLDLEPALGLKRAWSALETGNRLEREARFEKETLEFHEAVRAGYHALIRRYPERFRVIDASRDKDAVTTQIIDELASFMRTYMP